MNVKESAHKTTVNKTIFSHFPLPSHAELAQLAIVCIVVILNLNVRVEENLASTSLETSQKLVKSVQEHFVTRELLLCQQTQPTQRVVFFSSGVIVVIVKFTFFFHY